MVTERYELAAARIEEILTEETVGRDWLLYFRRTAAFLRMIHELKEEVESGRYRVLSMEELEEWNRRLYLDVMPEQYENSFANPAYAVRLLGKEYGQILSFLYTEIRGSIVYAFERKTEYLAILYCLLRSIIVLRRMNFLTSGRSEILSTGMPAITAMCLSPTGSGSRSIRNVLLRSI